MSQKHPSQTGVIVLAIVAAIGLAFVLPELNRWHPPSTELFLSVCEAGGEIFLRLLKMLVVPLVVCSVMTGVLGLGDVRKLRGPAARTLLFFLATTFIAVVIGIVMVNIIAPGLHTAAPDEATLIKTTEAAKPADPKRPTSVGGIVGNLARMLFTDNLIQSAATMDLLPLILFAIVFAGILSTMGERVATLKRVILDSNEVLMGMVLLVMRVAPLGIFCLVAARFGRKNIDGKLLSDIQATAWYMSTVISGLAVHAVVLLVLYAAFTKKSPLEFLRQMSQALLTAFSTASSNATLPVTMECVVDRAGISRKSADFVIPLGATINMNGTALYEAVAALYIAQALGHSISLADQVIIALTATLAAIGAAGIPEAGLVTMVIVLNAVNLPTEGMQLILAVDWLLDRFRTTVNVFGDMIGAAVVDPAFRAAEGEESAPSAESA